MTERPSRGLCLAEGILGGRVTAASHVLHLLLAGPNRRLVLFGKCICEGLGVDAPWHVSCFEKRNGTEVRFSGYGWSVRLQLVN
jgi:hypothetical protein